MALTAVKSWNDGEVLTDTDLNAEFANGYNNGEDFATPWTKAHDANGKEFILDADQDTSITSDTDDQIDFRCGGTDVFTLTGDGFTIANASMILMGQVFS